MPSSTISRIITTLVVGLVVFILAIYLPKFFLEGVIAPVAATQALELILTLLAIAILGGARFAEYGFRLPQGDYLAPGNTLRVGIVAVVAVVLGMAATSAVLLTGAVGNPIIKKMNIFQIMLFVWIFSSIIEEIFTRGFIQSHIARATNASIRLVFFRVEIPVLIGALAFASMHLVLLRSGADVVTLIIILPFTFLVGILAGRERSRSASLIPAIGVHMLANIGGLLGGIVYAIISVLSGHGLPTP